MLQLHLFKLWEKWESVEGKYSVLWDMRHSSAFSSPNTRLVLGSVELGELARAALRRLVHLPEEKTLIYTEIKTTALL